ncbi:MAG: type II toxin-antitoxin system VapC family toxin [Steroidobacteraceae bacterium]
MDTNAYTAFKCGDAATVAILRHAPAILVSIAVLGELLAGFAAGSRQNENRDELTRFLNSPRVRVVPFGPTTADCYALIYAALRRQGQPIPTNDLWIAASCLEHGAALLSFDGHFQHIGGLRVGTRLEAFLP